MAGHRWQLLGRQGGAPSGGPAARYEWEEGGREESRGEEGHHVHVPPGLTEDQCPLQSIGLGGNDIQDEGAALLATALKSNTHLQCLGLGGNQICEPYSCTVLLNEGGKHSLKLTVVDIL